MSPRWIWLVALVVAVAGCGGPATNDEGSNPPAQADESLAADGDGDGDGTANDGGGSAATGEGPVTATLDAHTYGFAVGTCTVAEDRVEADAGTDVTGSFAFLVVDWHDDDSTDNFRVAVTGMDGPAPFELYADANRPETSWEVTVEGTTATIAARMANELPAAQGDPDVAFYDVVIRIDCAQRGFGGMPEPVDDDSDATPMPEPSSAPMGESQVTLSLGAMTYGFTYPGCPMEEDYFAFVAANAEFMRLFIATEEVTLVLPDGATWGATGVDWSGDEDRFSWSGTMTSAAGDSQQATVEIRC